MNVQRGNNSPPRASYGADAYSDLRHAECDYKDSPSGTTRIALAKALWAAILWAAVGMGATGIGMTGALIFIRFMANATFNEDRTAEEGEYWFVGGYAAPVGGGELIGYQFLHPWIDSIDGYYYSFDVLPPKQMINHRHVDHIALSLHQDVRLEQADYRIDKREDMFNMQDSLAYIDVGLYDNVLKRMTSPQNHITLAKMFDPATFPNNLPLSSALRPPLSTWVSSVAY